MPICGKELFTAIVIMFGCATFGAILCYPSPAQYDIISLHKLDDLTWSFYNSVSSLFAIAGPFLSNWLLVLFNGSRKMVVFTLAVSASVLWFLLLLTTVHIWAGIVIRALLGVIMGAYSQIDPMYLVEIAPPDAIGFFGCLNQSGIVIGILFLDFIGPSCNYKDLCYAGASLTIFQAIAIWFCLESPAKNSEPIATTMEPSTEKESLWQRKYAPGLLIGVGMMFFQQFCGINGILTNLTPIMDASGMKLDGDYQAGIATVAQLIAVFVGGSMIDHFGRRTMWVVSSIVVAIPLFIYALNEKYAWSVYLPLICVFVYQFGFGLGFGPIPWFIIPEYFPDSVRSAATTLVATSNWTLVFVIILIWPKMIEGVKMFGSLIIFGVFTVFSIIFGIFGIREPAELNPEAAVSRIEPADQLSEAGAIEEM